MSLRGGCFSRRHLHRTAFGAVQVSNLRLYERIVLPSKQAITVDPCTWRKLAKQFLFMIDFILILIKLISIEDD